jgi:thiamine biosynthesis lipoprotein
MKMRPQVPPVDVARRRLLALSAFGACVTAWPVGARERDSEVRLRESRPLMGTRVDIAVQGRDGPSLKAAQAAAFERMAALEAVMSHYAPTSRVAAINLMSGIAPVAVEPELMQVLTMARQLSRRTQGAFDVTIGSVGRWHFDPRDPRMPAPGYIQAHLRDVDWRNLVLDERAGTAYLTRRGMRIDLGGVAKLYILQAGLDVLRQHGVAHALVNGGGDVVATSEPAARPWRVGIRDPRQPARLLASIDVRNGFVASSGDYERFFERDGRRYHHVLDPRTGYPAQGPHGVTLVGRDLPSVNGIGAAAMVLAARAGHELVLDTPGLDALIAARDAELWTTDGMRRAMRS